MNVFGQTKIDSLKSFLSASHNDTVRLKLFVDIGSLYQNSAPDSSIRWYNSALHYANDIIRANKSSGLPVTKTCKTVLAKTYLNIGVVSFALNDHKEALANFEKSLEIAEVIKDVFLAAECTNNLGYVNKMTGNYAQAISFFERCLKLRMEAGNKEKVADCYSNLGVTYMNIGNYTLALEYYLKSLKTQEEWGNKQGVSGCYLNIGTLQLDQENYKSALEYFQKALKLKKELNDKPGIGNCLNNIGNVYRCGADYKSALEYYLQSFKIKEELNDKRGLSKCMNNIGNVYWYQEIYKQSLEYYKKALALSTEIEDKSGVASYSNNVGFAYKGLGDYALAIEYSEKGLSLAKETGSLSVQRLACNNISECYEKLNNPAKALEYFKLFKQISDSIYNSDKSAQLQKMEAIYQNEKQHKEIEILNKDNKIKEYELHEKLKEMQKQRILIYSFILGFVIISVFSFLLYMQFKAKKRANILLAMQNMEIRRKNEEISAQRDEIEAQRDMVTRQKEHIEEIHSDLTDSIYYAERIQKAVLPDLSVIASASEAISHNTTTLHPNTVIASASEAISPNTTIETDFFILFKPRDIVSGDFYWVARRNDWLFVSVADCTGHGVPGAFMSMLGVSFLNEIIARPDINTTGSVLDELRKCVIKALQQSGKEEESKDGMDIALCAINTCTDAIHGVSLSTGVSMQFSGANNPLYVIVRASAVIASDREAISINETTGHPNTVIASDSEAISPNTTTASEAVFSLEQIASPASRNDEFRLIEVKADLPAETRLIEVKADKQPVAIYEQMHPFTTHELQVGSGDVLYLCTDGYHDQFGGVTGKKFLSKNLKQLLLDNCKKPMNEQKEILNKTIEDWKNGHSTKYEQTDDITILGIRI